MPDLPIVDAHVHLWQPDRFRMSCLDGDALLNRRYDLAEHREHTAGVDIGAMVYLQVDAALSGERILALLALLADPLVRDLPFAEGDHTGDQPARNNSGKTVGSV